jgi:hypothetical protein
MNGNGGGSTEAVAAVERPGPDGVQRVGLVERRQVLGDGLLSSKSGNSALSVSFWLSYPGQLH